MEGIWTIVITAAVSVVATLGTTWFGHRLGLSKDRALRDEEIDRHARYLAIRVVCVLEPFVSACIEVTNDAGVPAPPEGEFECDTATPKLVLPEEVDWRTVDPELMYRILGLPNEIAVADQSICFVGSEISSPPYHSQYFWERSIRYARLGLTAQKLADDLRTRYGIPVQDHRDWNPREYLELRLSKVEQEKAEYKARQAGSKKKMREEYEAGRAATASAALEAGKS